MMMLLHPLRLIPSVHAAIDLNIYCAPFGSCDGAGRGLLIAVAVRVGNAVLLVVAGTATIALIYAGLKLVFSAGNDQAVEEAKKIARISLSGVVLAMASAAIVTFVGWLVGAIAS